MAYLDPYVASLGDYMDIHATLHLPPGRQLTPSDATMAAVVYARRVCTAATISETSASTAALVADFSQRPRLHATAKEWYWDLSFGHAYAAAAAAHPARQVSLSSFAAGACGNLCARTTFPLSGRGGACIKALMSARLGGCSLYYEPLGPASWAPSGDAALPANYYHDIARGSQCPLCKGPTADPFHIVCECPHPAVAAERARLCSSAVQYVPVLAGHIYSANPVPQSRDLDTAVNVARRAAPPDWRSPQGRSLLFRLVMVLPWPAASVVDGDPLATALGSLMDLTIVRNNRLHPKLRIRGFRGGASASSPSAACGRAQSTASRRLGLGPLLSPFRSLFFFQRHHFSSPAAPLGVARSLWRGAPLPVFLFFPKTLLGKSPLLEV